MLRYRFVNSNMDWRQGCSDMGHSWFSAPLAVNDTSHIGLKSQTDR